MDDEIEFLFGEAVVLRDALPADHGTLNTDHPHSDLLAFFYGEGAADVAVGAREGFFVDLEF